MRVKDRTFSGTVSLEERAYEIENREIARMAAEEGVVLLKNEHNTLPVPLGSRIALYGAGAVQTVKGGTGSGNVNARKVVNIYQGLLDAGYQIVTGDWIQEYRDAYRKAKYEWRDKIWNDFDKRGNTETANLFYAYTSIPFVIPAGSIPQKKDADVAVFVLSRVAGEGMDGRIAEGDYLLTKEEKKILHTICEQHRHVILILNTGGIVDVSFLNQYANIDSILYILYPGMEVGNAVANILSGKVTPSGKLTDTWAVDYKDYPNASTFSYHSGNTECEEYKEDIYVGYRYFDTYDVPVRYCFGYGLSYTDFKYEVVDFYKVTCAHGNPKITIKVRVTNIGEKYCGKEVIQVYCACPQNKQIKEFRRLAGFKKTKQLSPGETQDLTIEISLEQLTSYDERVPGWVLERGYYGFFVGNSLQTACFSKAVEITEDVVLTYTENVCPLKRNLNTLVPGRKMLEEKQNKWLAGICDENTLIITASEIAETNRDSKKSHIESEKVCDFVNALSETELIQLSTGEFKDVDGTLIFTADVPGAAAQTSHCAIEKNLASIILSDAPAGLHLNTSYQVEDGKVIPQPLEMNWEDGFLCRQKYEPGGITYYQYCTAFPVGNVLAQTWNPEVLYAFGKAVAREMKEYGISIWLAPAMNIHRNPLCGRNFEYFSEDPFLTGCTAISIIDGIQSEKGCGATVKHFACNNQEENRMNSDSVVSERALREIYLRGFELAIKNAHPKAIMTSYNLINGVHAANNYDLCTKIARNEWMFEGVIMTDWTTTNQSDDCTASGCILAGNDLVMPGTPADHEDIRKALESGRLGIDVLRQTVSHLVNVIRQSDQYVE